MSHDGVRSSARRLKGGPVTRSCLPRRSYAEDVKPSMMDCPIWAIQQGAEDEEGRVTWETTEGLWFTHAEAKKWAKAHAYRLGKTWRVYGLPARGELKALLKALTI